MSASGITRTMILDAAEGLRTSNPDAADEQLLDRLVRDIIGRAVPVGTDRVDYTAYPTAASATVAGLLVDVSLARPDTTVERSLAIAALAATDEATPLQGSVIVSGLPLDAAEGGSTLLSASLSGDVYVSAPLDVSNSGVLRVALMSGAVPSPEAVPDPPAPTVVPRTARERAAAKKAYDADLRTARTKYAKAKKKAGKSKRRRIVAKKAYAKRRAQTKTAYRAAIADVPGTAAPRPLADLIVIPSAIISTDVGWGTLV